MVTIPYSAPINKPQGKHYVYSLAYPDSMGGRVFYIGKGIGRRIHIHEWQVKNNKLPEFYNPYKVNVIRKILRSSEQVVETKLACFETHEEACQYEIALIFFMDGLTNLTDGGEGNVGWVPSEITLERIREAHKELWNSEGSEERRKRASETTKKQWESEEFRRFMSESQKGRPVSEERRLGLIKANTGRVQPAEERQRRSIALKKVVRSEEHQRKLNEAARNRSPEWSRKQSEAQKEVWKKRKEAKK